MRVCLQPIRGGLRSRHTVREKLKAFEMLERLGTGSCHPTLGASVDACLADYDVDWMP